MTLLTPWALLGLGLLAIPVIVHLFKPRHVRQTPFSSLRWLHLTQQRMARRIQWHQVLLFLLRAGFLTLIVFALSRPIWSPVGTASGVDRIVVLDFSRSMGRHIEGRPTPFDTARQVASQLIRGTLPGDRTAILLTGNTTEVLAPWTTNAALYLPTLSSIQPGMTETQLDSSFEPIRSLLAQRRPGVNVEIDFLTDNPTNGWNTSEISRFSAEIAEQPQISLRWIDVNLPAPRNGWVAAARLRTKGTENVLHVEATCVGEANQPRTLQVSGLTGVEGQSFPMVLQPGRKTVLDLPLPTTFSRDSSLVTLKLDQADELPDDDTFFVDLDSAGATRMLLIVPKAGPDAGARPSLPLETAIRSLAETGSLAADGPLTIRTLSAVASADIDAADLIFLVDIPGLNESLATALSDRVRAGATLVMFLGPPVEYEVYNRCFWNPLAPDQSLLPCELAGSVSADPKTGLAEWKNWNDRHPVLAGLVDPKVGDLAATESRHWYRFAKPMATTEDVLATHADGAPALVFRRVAAGRVVIFNASADDKWCDLPRRKSYVPLVDRMLAYLQSSGVRRQFTSGETIIIALPEGFDAGTSPPVTSPSGKSLPTLSSASAGRTWITLPETREAGFYRVASPAGTSSDLVLVAQPGRGDSRLESFDAETFQAWWSPAEMKIEQPTGAQALASAADRRVALEPWLVGLACLCFLAEMFLVHWSCPRMNPALSVSHHRRRGFVAPLKEREEAVS